MTLSFLVSVALAQCADRPRATNVNLQGNALETGARRAARDLCPDRAAPSSPDAQAELLEEVRARTLPRLRATTETERAGDGSTLMKRFDEMRLALARSRGDVTFTRGQLRVVPAVRLESAPGFAKLDQLTPAENERLQASYAGRLREANERLPSGASRERVGQIGNELRDELRQGGQADFARLTAKDPALLFVEADRDVFAARARYVKALEAEARALPNLRVRPPSGEALALVYYAPIVTEVLRERPQLCGAFLDLKARADRLGTLHDVAKGALDLTSNGVCTALGLVSRAPSVTVGCLALGWSDWSEGMGGARYQERRLLYGDLSSTRSLAYTY